MAFAPKARILGRIAAWSERPMSRLRCRLHRLLGVMMFLISILRILLQSCCFSDVVNLCDLIAIDIPILEINFYAVT